MDDVEWVSGELRRPGLAVDEPHHPGTGLTVAEPRDPDGRRIAIESRDRQVGAHGAGEAVARLMC